MSLTGNRKLNISSSSSMAPTQFTACQSVAQPSETLVLEIDSSDLEICRVERFFGQQHQVGMRQAKKFRDSLSGSYYTYTHCSARLIHSLSLLVDFASTDCILSVILFGVIDLPSTCHGLQKSIFVRTLMSLKTKKRKRNHSYVCTVAICTLLKQQGRKRSACCCHL